MYDNLEPEIDIMKNSGIVVTKELLPAELCDEIITLYEHIEATEPGDSTRGNHQPKAVASQGHNQLIRTDRFICLDEVAGINGSHYYPQTINEHISRALEEYMEMFPILNRSQTALYSIRQKLQKTPVSGGYHSWHAENDHLESCHRMLAWTIYLNDVPEGGETEFLYQSQRVSPEKGKTCIFPAGFMHTHRGNPPISNDKYILTGWFNLRMVDEYYWNGSNQLR